MKCQDHVIVNVTSWYLMRQSRLTNLYISISDCFRFVRGVQVCCTCSVFARDVSPRVHGCRCSKDDMSVKLQDQNSEVQVCESHRVGVVQVIYVCFSRCPTMQLQLPSVMVWCEKIAICSIRWIIIQAMTSNSSKYNWVQYRSKIMAQNCPGFNYYGTLHQTSTKGKRGSA